MYLELDESDRIIVEYNGPAVGDCQVCGSGKDHFLHGDEEALTEKDMRSGLHDYVPNTQNHIVVAAGDDVMDTDIYMVLWKLRHRNPKHDNKWQVMWRGNWQTSMKVFAELVGDVDADAMIEARDATVEARNS